MFCMLLSYYLKVRDSYLSMKEQKKPYKFNSHNKALFFHKYPRNNAELRNLPVSRQSYPMTDSNFMNKNEG